jgi:peroxiredoxin
MAAKKRSATRAVAGDRRPKAPATTRSSSTPATPAKASSKAKATGKTPRASLEKAPRVRGAVKAIEGRSTRKTPVEAATTKNASKGLSRKPAVTSVAPKPVSKGSAKPGASLTPLDQGDRAPAFTLIDHRGQSISSAELAGHPYVLYFYPKDDTPGCTVEACGFRDAASEFDKAGVRVIGVSPDNVASHQRFIAKHNLPFTLLCDGEQELATAYGTWALKKNYGREYMGIVRSTFLIGGDGLIKNAWRSVRVNGHVAAVQAAAQQLS